MNISCEMADDLLPLYLDGVCSGDSRAALEEHLKECPACRAKLDRMGRGIPGGVPVEMAAPELAGYAKKVRKHRIRAAALTVLVAVFASAILALGYLTVQDMRRQASPHVFEVEPGTCNLTAGELEITAEEAGQYVLFTNYTQISVTVQAEGSFQGTVMLWNTANDDSFILNGQVDETNDTCTFQNLTAALRYRVTCDGLDGATLIISEGREVSVWNSLCSVLGEIVGR